MGIEEFKFSSGSIYGRGWMSDFVASLLMHDVVLFLIKGDTIVMRVGHATDMLFEEGE